MSDDGVNVGTGRRQRHALPQGPFGEVFNVHLFFGGGGRGAIVEDIVRRRRDRHAVVQVHGESGSGLSFLSLVLAERLRQRCNVIRHDAERLGAASLLRHLLIELCPREATLIGAAEARVGADAAALELAARHLLAELRRAPPGGKPYLLIIDATRAPDARTLALLGRLAAVRRRDAPAMHVVLFRPDTAETVRAASIRTDANAADGHYWLRRLTLTEVGDYLRHRMTLFDYSRRDLFTREMVYFIADRSSGLPRAIDVLTRNAFTLASLENDEQPSMAHLLAAGLPARETPRGDARPRRPGRGLLVALLGLAVVGSIAALLLLA